MSNIETYLGFIQTKEWASEVRTAIVQAISQCYSDVHNPTLTTAGIRSILEEFIADGTIPTEVMTGLGFITEKSETNLFDFTDIEEGGFNDDGSIKPTPVNYWVSGYIAVTPSTKYYCTGQYRSALYKSDKSFISFVTGTVVNTTEETAYIRVSLLKTNLNVVKINANVSMPYEPGRSAIDYNLRRKVYTKDEIDSMFGLTTAQINSLISLIEGES